MGDSGAFSEEDELQPVYCARCKRHVPRAALGEYPYCPPCLAQAQAELEQRRAEEERLAREAEERRRQEEKNRALREQQAREQTYALDTGMGACPQCGSRNLRQFRTGGEDNVAQAGTCCVGCLFFWPLMLLAPFLFRRPVTLHRACNSCGWTWQV